ncbi:MAG: crossover junction endodeoxyribonuclease RuvC [Candidatus Vogelbacteria bacterium]|nr:crossover junction endodeoxyribonuclease RuvC [Candidatus Vogelbacteria bacterium]
MRVLGVDPGYDRMGVAIVEKQNGKEVVLFSACLTTKPKDDFADRLLFMGDELTKIIKKWKPNALSIEKLFISNNQKTATNIAEVRGMVIYLARAAKLTIGQYTPMEIKMACAGYGSADKKQVTNMIEKLVCLPKGKRLDDEYDAIGAALTHLACYKYQGLK